MTAEKMPDVQIPNVVYLSWEKENDIKLYRAEPVEELLKQARDVMEYIGVDDYCDPYYDDDKIDATITAINKFLGENK